MHTQKDFLLVFIFIVITLGLLATLMPVLDIDADGSSDSVVTEGILMTTLLSAPAAFLHLSIRFASVRLD